MGIELLMAHDAQNSLVALIELKNTADIDLSGFRRKIQICKNRMVENGETDCSELEDLQHLELGAQEILDRAVEAVIKFEPETARDHALKATTIADSILSEAKRMRH